MAKRVIVTGLGVVSPIGSTLEEFWNALLYEESGPQEFPYARTSYMSNRLAYCVRDEPAADSTATAESRTVRFAARAAHMALQDAGVLQSPEAVPIGVCLGTGNGNHDISEAERERGQS